ncbi:uncharacterized protein Gasu_35160 [Galdieria sulphuraria]|uniref:Uncharacterized protein n=1 Tax=Galdieria sulphuraria TaxID=130081 RepID=M2XGE8_GALSU|nr:uncharacterized protein Gasu_35160 [Galdieria sulphuraria]EME29127.1 hypothetical protein Gasu_35160 [Galdieria sulphuraria]|eukprot:XP_005705647.1 hypothetical protein Gasu_35160 [Galdieria sulphuraria]
MYKTFRTARQLHVTHKWQRLFCLKHWFRIGIGFGTTICIYQYYKRKSFALCKSQDPQPQSHSCVTRRKKCFEEDILSFLCEVSFLKHNRELHTLDKINVLCLLGPSATKEDILPYLLDSNRILCMETIQEGTERVIGEKTCILFISIDEFSESLKRRQLAQIKYLLRGLATWNCAAMDAIITRKRFLLFHRLLFYFGNRLSETAHAVLIYSPWDTTNIVLQRTIQVAMKEGIPLLILSDCYRNSFESRIEELCFEMKRCLIQRLVFEHPVIRYLHPFIYGQNWIIFLFQLVIMGVYYWWKAHSMGYKDGFEDGGYEWNYRLIGMDLDSIPYRDDELWEFCYGSSSVFNWYVGESERMSCLLQSLNKFPFLGLNEIFLYKKYIRLLFVDGCSYLIARLFDSCYDQNNDEIRQHHHSMENDFILEKPHNRIYVLDGNISIWTLPWSHVIEKVSIRNFLHHATVDWGSFDSFGNKPFLWQFFMNGLLTICQPSILASRWNNSMYRDILISSYYYHQNVCRFLNGIDGIILPIGFSKGESFMKFGKDLIEECLKQQIPVFFVDCFGKEHSSEISNRLGKAIRRTMIQRALKIQQQRYISARTHFFLWLYTWRYDRAYLQGYRQAWMLRMSSHEPCDNPIKEY